MYKNLQKPQGLAIVKNSSKCFPTCFPGAGSWTMETMVRVLGFGFCVRGLGFGVLEFCVLGFRFWAWVWVWVLSFVGLGFWILDLV